MVRKADTVSRLGGGEYVVLLPGIDEVTLRAVAERIIAEIRDPIEIGPGLRARVGLSIGIACSDRDGTTPEDLPARADMALHGAKRSGKGRFRLAS